ncbi:MAG: dihydroneopterin aldolase [Burkholderiales bacterium]
MPANRIRERDAAQAAVALDLKQTRRVFLKNLIAQVSMGIYDHEKIARQPVIVNLEVFLDPAARIARDSIRETVDYNTLRNDILRIADSGHFHLQETFCEQILAVCLEKPGVIAARVCSEKPEIYPDCESVGFEIFAVK